MQTGGESDLASLTRTPVLLRSHLDTAKSVATRLTQKIGLDRGLADAIVKACERHDTGQEPESGGRLPSATQMASRSPNRVNPGLTTTSTRDTDTSSARCLKPLKIRVWPTILTGN